MKKSKKAKILIFAPHPDDELINAGCKIAESRNNGDEVTIVYVTIGADKMGAYANLRKKAVSAILNKEKLVFFGYPEKALFNLDRFKEAVRRTSALIKRIDPDEIYIPAYEGGHADHDLTHLLVVKSTSKELYEYTTYNNYFSLANFFGILKNAFRKRAGLAVFEKKRFIPKKIPTISVGGSDAVAKKNRMVEQYAKIVQGRSIKASYGQDQFRLVTGYDYSKPPHKRFPLKLRYETAYHDSFERMRQIAEWR